MIAKTAVKMSEDAFETQAAFVIPEMEGQVFSPEHESMDDVKHWPSNITMNEAVYSSII